MKRLLWPLMITALVFPQAASSVTYSRTETSGASTGVSLHLDDPSGSVYQEGEAVRFTVRTERDAYVMVFDIDTDGFVHLLFPQKGQPLRKFTANRDHPIPARADESFIVTGRTGMEFVFAVAVANQDAISEREISFLHDGETAVEARKFRIDGDPFLAANRIASQLVRGIRYSPDVSLAYTYFYVNEAVDYPRYLCEDCYEQGKDPYEENLPNYVATASFEREDHLSYPLRPAFEVAYTDNLRKPDGYDDAYTEDGETSVRRVYVTYYPTWYHGYYNYYDPWWYYPGGFYFSFGWHYRQHCYYYPYYHFGYRHYPYYYYGHYGHRYYDHWYGHHARGFRHLRPDGSRYRYKGTRSLYAGLNVDSERQSKLRVRTFRERRVEKIASERPQTIRSKKTVYRPEPRPLSKPKLRHVGKPKPRPVSKMTRPAGPKAKPRGLSVDRRVHSPRSKATRVTRPVYRPRGDARSGAVRSTKIRRVEPRSFKRSLSSKDFKPRRSGARTHKFTGHSSSRHWSGSKSRSVTRGKSSARRGRR